MNRMNSSGRYGWLVAVAAAIAVVACGGGNTRSTTSTTPVGASAVSGVISGFGSVIVGGREFATPAGTTVLDGDHDDAVATTGDLQVGMMVDVDADGSTATRLRFRSVVRGEVDSVDGGNNVLTVLGQTVNVSGATSFAGARGSGATTTSVTQLSDVKAGDYVVVHGYIECAAAGCTSAPTGINATLVDEPATTDLYLAQGYARDVAADGSHFALNGLTVNLATTGARPTFCVPAGCAVANGDFVVVRAMAAPTGTFATTGSTLAVTAASVRKRLDAPTFVAGSAVTIEGAVSELAGTTFNVRGVEVDASAPSLASRTANLANGQIVEVTGTIGQNGTLTATAITIERFATMMLMAPLDTAPASMSLSLLGQTFTVDSRTRFADWAQGVRPFNASNFTTVLKAGDQVVVSGYSTAGGNVATRVERIPSPARPVVAVEGFVTAENTSASPETFTVAGVTASVGSATALFYPGAARSPTEAGFFAAITPNTSMVFVLGAPSGTAGRIDAASARVLNPGVRWR